MDKVDCKEGKLTSAVINISETTIIDTIVRTVRVVLKGLLYVLRIYRHHRSRARKPALTHHCRALKARMMGYALKPGAIPT